MAGANEARDKSALKIFIVSTIVCFGCDQEQQPNDECNLGSGELAPKRDYNCRMTQMIYSDYSNRAPGKIRLPKYRNIKHPIYNDEFLILLTSNTHSSTSIKTRDNLIAHVWIGPWGSFSISLCFDFKSF